METLIVAGLATTVGKGFLLKMIYDSYDLIKNTATHYHPYLQSVLNELDLKADLEVIESLLHQIKEDELAEFEEPEESEESEESEELEEPEELEELEELDDPINQIGSSKHCSRSPIQICFKNVSEMISLIKVELENIQEEIKNHQNKWFASWRTPDYEEHIHNLKNHKKILDKRVNLLIKILNLREWE